MWYMWIVDIEIRRCDQQISGMHAAVFTKQQDDADAVATAAADDDDDDVSTYLLRWHRTENLFYFVIELEICGISCGDAAAATSCIHRLDAKQAHTHTIIAIIATKLLLTKCNVILSIYIYIFTNRFMRLLNSRSSQKKISWMNLNLKNISRKNGKYGVLDEAGIVRQTMRPLHWRIERQNELEPEL